MALDEQSNNTMSASQGKNGMVREVGELMKLPTKTKHQSIYSEGEGCEMRKIKIITNGRKNKKNILHRL